MKILLACKFRARLMPVTVNTLKKINLNYGVQKLAE
jgi:hypothetical protein